MIELSLFVKFQRRYKSEKGSFRDPDPQSKPFAIRARLFAPYSGPPAQAHLEHLHHDSVVARLARALLRAVRDREPNLRTWLLGLRE